MAVHWLIDGDLFDHYREELLAAIRSNGDESKVIQSPSPPFRWDDVGFSYRETIPQNACVVAHGDIELMTRIHLAKVPEGDRSRHRGYVVFCGCVNTSKSNP